MDNLSSRYYKSEIFTIVTGGLLVIWSHFGVSDKQKTPFFNIEINDADKLVKLTAFILIFSAIYKSFEYFSSSKQARSSANSRIRFRATLMGVLAVFWISDELVLSNTSYENISALWFYVFIFYGLISGILIDVFLHSLLMIRTKKEAEKTSFGRIPPSASGPIILTVILGILVGFVYFKTHGSSPIVIKNISLYLFVVPVLLVFLYGLHSVLYARDKNGNIHSLSQYRQSLRELSDKHEYMYMQAGIGSSLSDSVPQRRQLSYKDYQQSVEDRYSEIVDKKKNRIRVKVLESIGIKFNGNGSDCTDSNGVPKQGSHVSVFKEDEANSDGLKVMLLPKPLFRKGREVVIPLSIIEMFMDRHIQKLASESIPLNIRKLVSDSLNMATYHVLQEQTSSNPLINSAFKGDTSKVKQLLDSGASANQAGNMVGHHC